MKINCVAINEIDAKYNVHVGENILRLDVEMSERQVELLIGTLLEHYGHERILQMIDDMEGESGR